VISGVTGEGTKALLDAIWSMLVAMDEGGPSPEDTDLDPAGRIPE